MACTPDLRQPAGCVNVGYVVEGRVYHPGDAVRPDAAIDCSVPAARPWLKLEAIDFVREVGAARTIPIHDAVLSDAGNAVYDRWFDLKGGSAYERSPRRLARRLTPSRFAQDLRAAGRRSLPSAGRRTVARRCAVAERSCCARGRALRRDRPVGPHRRRAARVAVPRSHQAAQRRLLMAFGAGAIMSAVATDLVAVAYAEAGAGPTASASLGGSLGYFALISLLERKGRRGGPARSRSSSRSRSRPTRRPRRHEDRGAQHPRGHAHRRDPGVDLDRADLHLGLGRRVGRARGRGVCRRLPEAIGVAAALLAGGIALSRILGRFALVVLAGAIAGGLGYQVLVNASDRFIAVVESVAAGAMIVVVVNEMVPIAVRGASRWAV